MTVFYKNDAVPEESARKYVGADHEGLQVGPSSAAGKARTIKDTSPSPPVSLSLETPASFPDYRA